MKPSITLSSLYGLAYAPYGAILPFMPILLRGQGCSDADIGVVSSASGLAAISTPLIIAHVADRYREPKVVIAGLLTMVSAASLFWWAASGLAALFIAAYLFFGAIISTVSLIDSYSIRYLEESGGTPQQLPSLRVWGSIGFTIPSLAFWFLQEQFAVSVAFVLPISAFAGLCAALVAIKAPSLKTPPAVLKIPSVAAARFVWHGELRTFFAVSALGGIASTFFYLGQPRLLQELGSSPGAVGLIINLGVAAEIIALPFLPAAIRQFGEKPLVAAAYLALTARLVILGMTESVVTVAGTQVLHAFMIAGAVVVPPLILAKHADGAFRFSLQSLYTTAIHGITRMFASWLWALLALLHRDSALGSVHFLLLSGSILSSLAFIYWSLRGKVSEQIR